MVNRASLLDTLVVSSPDDLPTYDQHRADGDATGRKAFLRFFDRRIEKWVTADAGKLTNRRGRPEKCHTRPVPCRP